MNILDIILKCVKWKGHIDESRILGNSLLAANVYALDGCVRYEVELSGHHVFVLVLLPNEQVAAVAEWYRHRIVAGFVTSSSPVPLKTRRVGQRCTLNLSRAETSSRWCGVVVRRGGPSSGVVHVT
ncbi:uncharacterized protein TNCV_2898501 [Trichonephila clavipes]|nr:uncharacterized protein TNCV_2898501 [Trichonephila clavipes]